MNTSPDPSPFKEWCDGRKFIPIADEQLDDAVRWLYRSTYSSSIAPRIVFDLLMEIAILREENRSLKRDLMEKE